MGSFPNWNTFYIIHYININRPLHQQKTKKMNNNTENKDLNRITLLVDGEYLLKRSFSIKGKYFTPSFGDITGLFLFLVSLRTIVKACNVNKVVLCWDGQNGGKLRYNIYEGYKANRKNKDWYNKITLTEAQIKFEAEKKESVLKTKVRIQQYLEEMFVRQICDLDIIEADDMIAQYVLDYKHKEYIYIFTNDRDLCQLVEFDNVNIYLANKKTIINKKNYFIEFKHNFNNIRVIKTFCGDTSDNIKGVDGLAEPTFLKYFPKAIKEAIDIDYVLEETNRLIEERKATKKKPLKVLNNIAEGIMKTVDSKDTEKLGREIYDLNYKIINLKEPFLTREAKHEIKIAAEDPLNEEDRGSKNLIKLMDEDGFRQIWNGTINDFFAPFYNTIIKEKTLSKKYNTNV